MTNDLDTAFCTLLALITLHNVGSMCKPLNTIKEAVERQDAHIIALEANLANPTAVALLRQEHGIV